MSGIKLLDIHNSSSAPSLKNQCWNFWYLLFFNVVCVFVFSIIQIIPAFLLYPAHKPFSAYLCNSVHSKHIEMIFFDDFCVDNGNNGIVTSILGSEEIGQKASTAQSYKDVGALKAPRFHVFHILQQDS